MGVLDRLKFRAGLGNTSPDVPLTPEQIAILLKEQPRLALEYESLCIQLISLLKAAQADPQSKILKKQLPFTYTQATEFNALLLKLYAQARPYENEKKRLRRQRKKLDDLLVPAANSPATPQSPKLTQRSFKDIWFAILQWIRREITLRNLIRLLVVRIRRLLINIGVLIESLTRAENGFNTVFGAVDKYFLGPLITYLSFLFLLPRLLINSFMTAWHTISHDDLSEEEKKLTWKQRFLIQCRERGFEWLNDILWVPVSIISVFLLVGPLSMVGMILSAAMFAWDVAIAIMRVCTEYPRITKLIEEHTLHLKTLEERNDTEGVACQKGFIDELHVHRKFEIKRHVINLINNGLVLVLSFFVVSIFALPVIVPIIASSLLLILTCVMFYLNHDIQNSRPTSKLESLNTTSYDILLKTMPLMDLTSPEERPSLRITHSYASADFSTDIQDHQSTIASP